MSSRPGLPQQSVYMRASVNMTRVTFRSECVHVISHWDAESGRSTPCTGERCQFCSVGYKKLDKYLIGVSSPGGGLQLLEVRRAQYVELCEIYDKKNTLIGARVDVYKRSDAVNARVVLEYRGHQEEEAWDISKAISGCGLLVPGGM